MGGWGRARAVASELPTEGGCPGADRRPRSLGVAVGDGEGLTPKESRHARRAHRSALLTVPHTILSPGPRSLNAVDAEPAAAQSVSPTSRNRDGRGRTDGDSGGGSSSASVASRYGVGSGDATDRMCNLWLTGEVPGEVTTTPIEQTCTMWRQGTGEAGSLGVKSGACRNPRSDGEAAAKGGSGCGGSCADSGARGYSGKVATVAMRSSAGQEWAAYR